MRELLADEKSAHLLVAESMREQAAGTATLDSKEWLGAHAMTLLIGVWNLFVVDLAHTPEEWWFWIPAAVWAAGLVVHAAWLIWRSRRRAQPPVAISRGEVAR